jgi:hypothetical protein
MCLTGVPMVITPDLRAREWADADAPRVGFTGGPTPAQRRGVVAAAAYSRLHLRQLEVLYVALGQQDAEREVARIFALLHRCQAFDAIGNAGADLRVGRASGS